MRTGTRGILIIFLSVLLTIPALYAERQAGKVHGKIYTDFHLDLTIDADQLAAFQVTRAYFGYQSKLNDQWSAKLTMDIDYKADDGQFTTYLKNAAVKWKPAKVLAADLGLIGLPQFKDQEKMWGYRYIYKSFMDQNQFGSSADLGLHLAIRAHKMVKVFAVVVNGDGYKAPQDAFGQFKVGGGLLVSPVKGLAIKVYYDGLDTGDSLVTTATDTLDPETQQNISTFIGYKVKGTLRIGAEYNMLSHKGYIKDYNLTGISAYAAYTIFKPLQAFIRFDQLSSKGDWNQGTSSKNDNNTLIAGFQYTPVKKVNIAPNFQLIMPTGSGAENSIKVYLNLEYKL